MLKAVGPAHIKHENEARAIPEVHLGVIAAGLPGGRIPELHLDDFVLHCHLAVAVFDADRGLGVVTK
jgi:hypothetical protein